MQDTINTHFKGRFRESPSFIVRAPGRVNIIGEHTDYNDGFVLPMAIDLGIWIGLRPREDRIVKLYSIDFNTWESFSLDQLEKKKGWLEYPKGVAWALQEADYQLKGWEGVLTGNVPRGSGLSSSAALELAIARAFYEVSNFSWDPKKMALIGQKAENAWVGANTGIMDQLISASGQEGYALKIDCRSLETQAVSLPANTSVVVMDTMTRHSHVSSGYNERREQCEQVAKVFKLKALRDLSLDALYQKADTLNSILYKRAKHVVSENKRTEQAALAMQKGDAATLGRLMNESHQSLRDDFEVSSDALNAMVNCAKKQSACYGARMTGGGFGGCAVALIESSAQKAFVNAVKTCYLSATGKDPKLYVCNATDGASTLAISS